MIGEGVNTVLRDGDPTAHAEAAAVRDACARTATRDLSGAYVASSYHPCPMCQAVAQLVGIDLIVHAGQFAPVAVDLPAVNVVHLPEPRFAEPFAVFAATGLPLADRPAT